MTILKINDDVLTAVKDVLIEAQGMTNIMNSFDDPRDPDAVFTREDIKRSCKSIQNTFNDLKGEVDYALQNKALETDELSLGFDWDSPSFSTADFVYESIRDEIESQGFTITTRIVKE